MWCLSNNSYFLRILCLYFAPGLINHFLHLKQRCLKNKRVSNVGSRMQSHQHMRCAVDHHLWPILPKPRCWTIGYHKWCMPERCELWSALDDANAILWSSWLYNRLQHLISSRKAILKQENNKNLSTIFKTRKTYFDLNDFLMTTMIFFCVLEL